MAVKYQMDEEARDTLDRRIRTGQDCIDAVGNGAYEEQETSARDAVSDILTTLFGPAGHCVVRNVWQWQNLSGPASASVDVPAEVVLDEERCTLARTFLDMALESWEGDAEDYTATLVTVDNPLLPETETVNPVVVVIRDPDASNEYRTFLGEVETYDIDAGYADLRDPEEFAEWRDSHLESAKAFREKGQAEVAEYIEEIVASYGEIHQG